MDISQELLLQRKHNLTKAVEYHGNLCSGQILGLHIAEYGLKLMETTDPKKLIIYFEIDRCIADAIQILIGTRFGRRTLKIASYGKMAATFVNLETGNAYRLCVSPDADEIMGYAFSSRFEAITDQEKLLELASEKLIHVQKVKVNIPAEDIPVKPMGKVPCAKCKEMIFDCKEIQTENGPICRACASIPYYTLLE